MPDFNFDLFTKPDQYEETLLRDRKAMVKYWEDAEQAEFVRDVIALANTARMLGQPAYLILGMRDAADDTLGDICGIGEMFERHLRRGKTEKQAQESIRHEMADILRRFVMPLFTPDIRFDTMGGKVVGYVLIPPLTGEPFRVSQEFRSGNRTYLRPGQTWLRFGESKSEVKLHELAPDDNRLRYSYAEIPYVLPSIWERYFEEVQREIQILWQKFGVPEESAYQPLHDTKGSSLEQVADDFLRQDEERLLILQGAAGCGKSLFLQRLVNLLAEQSEQETKNAQRLEQFTPPVGFIPIFYRLRDLTHKARTESAHFTKILSDSLAPLWEHGRRPMHPESLFENPNLNWLIVLDGLDEIGEHAQRREFLSTLAEFMRAYPRLRVILTTRPSPGISLESVDKAKLVEIAPLDESQLTNFLMAYRTDRSDEEIFAFIQVCQQWQDAWQLLSVPAYLNAAAPSLGIPRTITDVQEQPPETPVEVETSENSEILTTNAENSEIPVLTLPQDASLEVDAPVTPEPTKREDESDGEFILTLPRLLDQMYEAFWKREIKRNTFENANHLRCGTYKIAATSMKVCPDRIRRDHAKKHLKEKGLRWVLEMGILSENEHEHIFFTIPSAQVYSAAKQLQGDIQGGFWDDIFRYTRRWQDSYRVQIESFYYDLTGNSLSTILLTQGGSNG